MTGIFDRVGKIAEMNSCLTQINLRATGMDHCILLT